LTIYADESSGFYIFGCFAMLGIFYILAIEGRRHAKHIGSDVNRVYTMCGVWTLFIWLLYPIAWGLSEGGNVITPDSEAVFYGVLDFCAKPIFSILLIIGHWNIDPARLGLTIREYDVGTTEKHAKANRGVQNDYGTAVNGGSGVDGEHNADSIHNGTSTGVHSEADANRRGAPTAAV
jgi:bacteriorhodopsin